MSRIKPVVISDHDVRVRAYKIWEKDGKPNGRAEEHWRKALAELEAEHRASMKEGRTAHVPARPKVSSRPTRIAATAISKSLRG